MPTPQHFRTVPPTKGFLRRWFIFWALVTMGWGSYASWHAKTEVASAQEFAEYATEVRQRVTKEVYGANPKIVALQEEETALFQLHEIGECDYSCKWRRNQIVEESGAIYASIVGPELALERAAYERRNLTERNSKTLLQYTIIPAALAVVPLIVWPLLIWLWRGKQ